MVSPTVVEEPLERAPGLHTRWPHVVIAALAVAVVLVTGYTHRWISDDALVYLRPVRNILEGNGPVFNAGERAEAATGTLWQWLLALTGGLGVGDLGRIAVFLGLLCSAAAVALGLDGARRLHGRTPVLLPAGVIVVLALPPFWDFATSGLETGLSYAWIALAWWLLVRNRDGLRDRYLTAVVLGLGPLVRPDLVLVSVVFLLAWWLLARPGWRTALACAAAAAALPVGYQIFRMGYYGVLVPLPAISKEAGDSVWARGWTYLADLFTVHWLWLPVLLVLAAGVAALGRAATRADWILVLAPVLAGVLAIGYVVKVGGDFMHGRMLLPGVLLVVLPFFSIPLTAGIRRAVLPVTAVFLAWTTASAVSIRAPYAPQIGPAGIADERAFYTATLGDETPDSARPYVEHVGDESRAVDLAMTAPGRELAFVDYPRAEVPLGPRVPADVAVVWRLLGTAGEVVPLDQIAIDQIGLAYPLAAHVELTRHTRAGHEKVLPNVWILADYADPDYTTPYAGALDAARRALRCGDLAELRESVRAPMTWGRFFGNLFGAPRRTALRFPVNPVEAERKFCGSQSSWPS
ncbi:hypothetical protein [Amycolatopsis anabasis]|uniref:hypothetical protein n=1 Tax=Amycolatopsis anabasis TaxID=1840409 RepID=UPI001C55363A|nr:hypothetical protein [Amycolatopsis anabasis]